MKKLNNKGFAISTALYGLLIIVIILLAIILQTLKVGHDINKDAGESIKKELDTCKKERQDYYKCESESECESEKIDYKECLDNARSS